MKTPWNQDEPLEKFFRQIENDVLFSEQCGAPMSNTQAINMEHMIMVLEQVFKDASKEWKRLTLTQKTWPRFKTHFFGACQCWKVESRHNTGEHTNTEVLNGLENCARTTVYELQPMAHSTDSTNEEQVQCMANLTVQNQGLKDQLNSVISQISWIQKLIMTMQRKSPPQPHVQVARIFSGTE